MARLTGKTAVITGSGRRNGLGEAIALKLAREGANIVISDLGASRDESTPAEHIGEVDEMKAIAHDIEALGVKCETFSADVRSKQDMKALAECAHEKLGSLDIWVNNAGIGYLLSLIHI